MSRTSLEQQDYKEKCQGQGVIIVTEDTKIPLDLGGGRASQNPPKVHHPRMRERYEEYAQSLKRKKGPIQAH